MPRDRQSDESTDRLASGSATAVPLYRIHAVEAHSWSTLLLEDKFGRFFVGMVCPIDELLGRLNLS